MGGMLQKGIFQATFVIKNAKIFSVPTMVAPIGYNNIKYLLFSLI